MQECICMQIRGLAVLALAVFARAVAVAQTPDTLGRVDGIVFDSVTMRPAAGALVQLVLRNVPSAETRSTTADGRGRYEFRELPAGSYLIGFYFPGSDSLNIELPPAVVDIKAGERTRANLAVPSPRRIIAALCRVPMADSIGAIVGFLRDARNHSPMVSGSVSAGWNEITIGAAGITIAPVTARAAVATNGSFVLCGVAPGGEATFVGENGRDTSGMIVVRIPDHGLLRQDVSVGGTLNVRGNVVTDAGAPAVGAEVLLAGRDRPTMTDSAGAFRVFSARAGTQTLEARALGYLPERRAVTLTAGRDTSFEIRLTSLKKMLDTIQVVAERVYWADRGGFGERRRSGWGHFFDDQAIQKRKPSDIYDLLWTIPGVRVSRSGFQGSVTMRDGIRGCTPALHLDGVRLPASMVGELSFLVPVDQIAGMEVYGRAGVPAQFASLSGCGAIVIWTQASPHRRR